MRHNGNGNGGGGGLRDLVGALKDKASQTRATLHLLPQPPSPYHLPLLRSTTHSPSSPPSLRHLSSLLSLSQSSRASASSLVSSLMDRLCHTRSSPVALKCLFAFHFFLRCGPFILLDQLSFLPLRGGRNYLNLSGFRDDSYPLSWELSVWVRWYAAYLERAVFASRALGHHFLNSAATSVGEEVTGAEEAKVSGFANRDLLDEIESLARLIEETSRVPESCDDNPIVRAIKEFVLNDCSHIVRAVSVRVNEFAERLDLLSFADSVELVSSLKRLEVCGERIAEMFNRDDEKEAGAWLRVWDSIRVVRGRVGEGKKSAEAVKWKEHGVWSESARFNGGQIPSLSDSVLFPSGRLGSNFHPNL